MRQGKEGEAGGLTEVTAERVRDGTGEGSHGAVEYRGLLKLGQYADDASIQCGKCLLCLKGFEVLVWVLVDCEEYRVVLEHVSMLNI